MHFGDVSETTAGRRLDNIRARMREHFWKVHMKLKQSVNNFACEYRHYWHYYKTN